MTPKQTFVIEVGETPRASARVDTAELLETAIDRVLEDHPGLVRVDVALVTAEIRRRRTPELRHSAARARLD